MIKHSFTACTFAVCGLLCGSLPQASAVNVHMNVANDADRENPTIPFYHISGQPLDNGAAMLGTLEGSGWSYDTSSNLWYDGNRSYQQNDLSFSQLASIQNGFRNTLTETGNSGSISNGGLFSLSGEYTLDSALDGKPMYVKIESDSGFAIFLIQSKDPIGAPATYPSTIPGMEPAYDFQLEAAADQDFPYYVTCILGKDYNDGFQLLVPEPATATLSLLGLAALMMRRKR